MSKKRPGPGRPPKDEAALKNEKIIVLVTERQKARYDAATSTEGYDSLASWVRSALDARSDSVLGVE